MTTVSVKNTHRCLFLSGASTTPHYIAISIIISVAPSLSQERLLIPIQDLSSAPLDTYFSDIAVFVHQVRLDGNTVLIHCGAGVQPSRDRWQAVLVFGFHGNRANGPISQRCFFLDMCGRILLSRWMRIALRKPASCRELKNSKYKPAVLTPAT